MVSLQNSEKGPQHETFYQSVHMYVSNEESLQTVCKIFLVEMLSPDWSVTLMLSMPLSIKKMYVISEK